MAASLVSFTRNRALRDARLAARSTKEFLT
jgi:hypothetical protein